MVAGCVLAFSDIQILESEKLSFISSSVLCAALTFLPRYVICFFPLFAFLFSSFLLFALLVLSRRRRILSVWKLVNSVAELEQPRTGWISLTSFKVVVLSTGLCWSVANLWRCTIPWLPQSKAIFFFTWTCSILYILILSCSFECNWNFFFSFTFFLLFLDRSLFLNFAFNLLEVSWGTFSSRRRRIWMQQPEDRPEQGRTASCLCDLCCCR